MIYDQPMPVAIQEDKAETRRPNDRLIVAHLRKGVSACVYRDISIDANVLVIENHFIRRRHRVEYFEIVLNRRGIVAERRRTGAP